MPLELGSTNISDLYFGSLPIEKVYKGTEIVYQKLLPRGYTLCEYLESTGTQYMNLGFKPSTGISAKAKLTAPALGVVTACALGSMTSSSNRFDLLTFGRNVDQVFGLGYVQYNYLQPYTPKQTYELYAGLENGNQWLDVDGVRMYTGTVSGNISSNYNMLLFARYQYGNLNSIYTGKIWYVQIYQNGVLYMNLIPCLDANYRPCMYDTVSKQPFYNQGTGEFDYKVVKYPIPANYTLCEYLESTGTQYINTGYYSKSNSVYDMVIGDKSSVDTNAAGTIFGSSFGPALRYLTTGELRGGYNTGSWQSNSVTILDRNVIHMPSSTAFYNATQLTLGSGSNTNYKLAMFANFSDQGGTGIGGYGKVKIYRFKIYTGSTCERYFVPCLDSNYVPCMYDLVSKQTYYNSGTGDFMYKAISYKIPKNYTLCEYLEAPTGATYIDLGFNATNSTDIEIRGQYLTSGTGHFYGYAQLLQIPNNGHVDFRYNGVTYATSAQYNDIHTYRAKGRECYVDGTLVNTFNTATFESPYTLTLFTVRQTDGSAGVGGGSRLYYTIIRENGTVTKYLVPCLDAVGTPCMYDLVTRTHFYNVGSGSFNYG